MPLDLAEREWNRIDDGVLPYTLAAMRTAWVWLVIHLLASGLTPTRGEWIAPLTVFALLALATLFAQYGAFRSRTGARATLLIAFGGLGAVAVTLILAVGLGSLAPWDERWLAATRADLALDLVVVIVAVWLWRWGIVTGREPLSYDTLSFNFTLGVIVFFVAFAAAFGMRIVPLTDFLLPLFVFFGIGLASLAVASLQSARRFEKMQTGQSFRLNRYWLGTVAVVIGALLAGGLVLTQFFAPETFSGVLSVLAVILDLIVHLLFYVLMIIAIPIFAGVEFLGRLLPKPNAQQPQPLPTPPNFVEQFKDLQGNSATLSPELYLVLQVLAFILIAAIIFFIFVFAFRRFRVLLEEDVEETRETIFSFDLLREQLARLFQRKGAPPVELKPPFATIRGDDARAQIRRTYQALLAWASERGVPRSPGQTPLEYLSFMARGLHIYLGPISIITDAYLLARYSTAPISSARAEQVLRAWDTISRENGGA